jgi:hypothetical protein
VRTLVIEVEEDLVVHANERFVVEFRERDGRLVAEKVSALGSESSKGVEDREQAAEEWLQSSAGILAEMTEAEIAEARYLYLADRHLK